MMVSFHITKDRLSKSNVDAYGFCSMRVKDSSFLHVYSVVGGSTIDVLE